MDKERTSSSGPRKYTIPRKKRLLSEDCQNQVTLDSREGKDIVNSIKNLSLETGEMEHNYSISKIFKVDNPILEKEFQTKRSEMKDAGRSAKELSESLAFKTECYLSNVKEHCKQGLCCHGDNNVLGDSKMGVSLWKHPDVCLKSLNNWPDLWIVYLVVFRIVKGKVKAVTARRENNKQVMEPTPNFDCHVSKNIPNKSGTDLSSLMADTQYYLYEYDEDGLPVKRPRHCLPHAIIHIKKVQTGIIPDIRTLSIMENATIPTVDTHVLYKPVIQEPEQVMGIIDDSNSSMIWRGLIATNQRSLGVVAMHAAHKIGLKIWKSFLDVRCKIPLDSLVKLIPGDIRTAWSKPLSYREYLFSLCTLKSCGPSDSYINLIKTLSMRDHSAATITVDSSTTLFLVPSCKLTVHLGFCSNVEPWRMFCIIRKRKQSSPPLFPTPNTLTTKPNIVIPENLNISTKVTVPVTMGIPNHLPYQPSTLFNRQTSADSGLTRASWSLPGNNVTESTMTTESVKRPIHHPSAVFNRSTSLDSAVTTSRSLPEHINNNVTKSTVTTEPVKPPQHAPNAIFKRAASVDSNFKRTNTISSDKFHVNNIKPTVCTDLLKQPVHSSNALFNRSASLDSHLTTHENTDHHENRTNSSSSLQRSMSIDSPHSRSEINKHDQAKINTSVAVCTAHDATLLRSQPFNVQNSSKTEDLNSARQEKDAMENMSKGTSTPSVAQGCEQYNMNIDEPKPDHLPASLALDVNKLTDTKQNPPIKAASHPNERRSRSKSVDLSWMRSEHTTGEIATNKTSLAISPQDASRLASRVPIRVHSRSKSTDSRNQERVIFDSTMSSEGCSSEDSNHCATHPRFITQSFHQDFCRLSTHQRSTTQTFNQDFDRLSSQRSTIPFLNQDFDQLATPEPSTDQRDDQYSHHIGSQPNTPTDSKIILIDYNHGKLQTAQYKGVPMLETSDSTSSSPSHQLSTDIPAQQIEINTGTSLGNSGKSSVDSSSSAVTLRRSSDAFKISHEVKSPICSPDKPEKTTVRDREVVDERLPHKKRKRSSNKVSYASPALESLFHIMRSKSERIPFLEDVGDDDDCDDDTLKLEENVYLKDHCLTISNPVLMINPSGLTNTKLQTSTPAMVNTDQAESCYIGSSSLVTKENKAFSSEAFERHCEKLVYCKNNTQVTSMQTNIDSPDYVIESSPTISSEESILDQLSSDSQQPSSPEENIGELLKAASPGNCNINRLKVGERERLKQPFNLDDNSSEKTLKAVPQDDLKINFQTTVAQQLKKLKRLSGLKDTTTIFEVSKSEELLKDAPLNVNSVKLQATSELGKGLDLPSSPEGDTFEVYKSKESTKDTPHGNHISVKPQLTGEQSKDSNLMSNREENDLLVTKVVKPDKLINSGLHNNHSLKLQSTTGAQLPELQQLSSPDDNAVATPADNAGKSDNSREFTKVTLHNIKEDDNPKLQPRFVGRLSERRRLGGQGKTTFDRHSSLFVSTSDEEDPIPKKVKCSSNTISKKFMISSEKDKRLSMKKSCTNVPSDTSTEDSSESVYSSVKWSNGLQVVEAMMIEVDFLKLEEESELLDSEETIELLEVDDITHIEVQQDVLAHQDVHVKNSDSDIMSSVGQLPAIASEAKFQNASHRSKQDSSLSHQGKSPSHSMKKFLNAIREILKSNRGQKDTKSLHPLASSTSSSTGAQKISTHIGSSPEKKDTEETKSYPSSTSFAENQPLDNRNLPINNRNLPVNNKNLPVNSRNLPDNNRNLPVNNRNLPDNNRNLPVNNRNLPDNNRNVPVNNRNQPIYIGDNQPVNIGGNQQGNNRNQPVNIGGNQQGNNRNQPVNIGGNQQGNNRNQPVNIGGNQQVNNRNQPVNIGGNQQVNNRNQMVNIGGNQQVNNRNQPVNIGSNQQGNNRNQPVNIGSNQQGNNRNQTVNIGSNQQVNNRNQPVNIGGNQQGNNRNQPVNIGGNQQGNNRNQPVNFGSNQQGNNRNQPVNIGSNQQGNNRNQPVNIGSNQRGNNRNQPVNIGSNQQGNNRNQPVNIGGNQQFNNRNQPVNIGSNQQGNNRNQPVNIGSNQQGNNRNQPVNIGSNQQGNNRNQPVNIGSNQQGNNRNQPVNIGSNQQGNNRNQPVNIGSNQQGNNRNQTVNIGSNQQGNNRNQPVNIGSNQQGNNRNQPVNIGGNQQGNNRNQPVNIGGNQQGNNRNQPVNIGSNQQGNNRNQTVNIGSNQQGNNRNQPVNIGGKQQGNNRNQPVNIGSNQQGNNRNQPVNIGGKQQGNNRNQPVNIGSNQQGNNRNQPVNIGGKQQGNNRNQPINIGGNQQGINRNQPVNIGGNQEVNNRNQPINISYQPVNNGITKQGSNISLVESNTIPGTLDSHSGTSSPTGTVVVRPGHTFIVNSNKPSINSTVTPTINSSNSTVTNASRSTSSICSSTASAFIAKPSQPLINNANKPLSFTSQTANSSSIPRPNTPQPTITISSSTVSMSVTDAINSNTTLGSSDNVSKSTCQIVSAPEPVLGVNMTLLTVPKAEPYNAHAKHNLTDKEPQPTTTVNNDEKENDDNTNQSLGPDQFVASRKRISTVPNPRLVTYPDKGPSYVHCYPPPLKVRRMIDDTPRMYRPVGPAVQYHPPESLRPPPRMNGMHRFRPYPAQCFDPRGPPFVPGFYPVNRYPIVNYRCYGDRQ